MPDNGHATEAPRAAPDLPSDAPTLEARVLDQLFRSARTQNKWRNRPVPDATLQELYDLLKWGPTSANGMPGRFVFLRTPEGKEKLRPALSSGNMEKTMSAPVVSSTRSASRPSRLSRYGGRKVQVAREIMPIILAATTDDAEGPGGHH